MPSDLTFKLSLAGEGIMRGTVGLSTPKSTVPIGSGLWGAMALDLSYGTPAANKIRQWYHATRVLVAGADDDLDFSGSLTNEFGESVLLTSIKVLIVQIVSPDGIKKLRVGPQGLAAAFQGPWGGVTATDYKTVDNWDIPINHPFDGYPIVAGVTDKLRINNPSAVSVTYNIFATGQIA